MNRAGDSVPSASKGRIPGEAGLWILIFGDLMVFGLFFGTFAYYYQQQPDLFRASQATLNQSLGLLNTLLLLTSSYFVVRGLNAVRRGDGITAQRWILVAMVLGLGFVAVKAVEYGEKIHAGIFPVTNDFYMLYFGFTGIHLSHVLVGLGALAFLRSRLPKMAETRQFAVAEGCTIFWHLVDILWVVLFAIFYLHR
jgi:nitric oxide reductase NorE protein